MKKRVLIGMDWKPEQIPAECRPSDGPARLVYSRVTPEGGLILEWEMGEGEPS